MARVHHPLDINGDVECKRTATSQQEWKLVKKEGMVRGFQKNGQAVGCVAKQGEYKEPDRDAGNGGTSVLQSVRRASSMNGVAKARLARIRSPLTYISPYLRQAATQVADRTDPREHYTYVFFRSVYVVQCGLKVCRCRGDSVDK